MYISTIKASKSTKQTSHRFANALHATLTRTDGEQNAAAADKKTLTISDAAKAAFVSAIQKTALLRFDTHCDAANVHAHSVI